MKETQKQYLSYMAKEYYKAGLNLTPLGSYDSWKTLDNGKVIPLGKVPCIKDWQNSKVAFSNIRNYINKGNNIGFLLGDKDLVIDVDPRNGGLEGLKTLEEDLGFSLSDICPTVVTGSGGYHFYLKKSDTVKFSEHVEKYGKGVEFKTVGRQVVIAGSLHPGDLKTKQYTGNQYKWDDLGLPFNEIPICPYELENLIKRDTVHTDTNAGLMSNESIREILAKIPVESYSDNNSWFELMTAVHFASDGNAVEEFIDWSTSDPNYMNDGTQIRYRWNTLESSKDSTITHRTLLMHADRHGVDTRQYEAQLDFDVVEGHFENITLDSEAAAAQLQSLMNRVDPYELAHQLTADSPNEDIEECLLACLKADTITRLRCLKLIQRATRLTKADLKVLMKDIEERSLKDIGEILAGYVLEKEFNQGKHLLHNIDSEFWQYNGKHWEKIRDEYLGGQIIRVWQKIRDKVGIAITTTTVVNQCLQLLKMSLAVNKDVFGFQSAPKPVINCKNNELWIKSDGSFVVKKHSYKSYLTYCLDVEYDELAECPLWDKAILDIFSLSANPSDMVRHFEELIGYLIQPNKNIASWWMLKGFGSNGKSMVMEIVGNLMGQHSILSTGIHELNTSRNNHALEDLPGKLMVLDDDLDTNTTLPDGILKKVSERKLLKCNPKGKGQFGFISCATPILLTNYFPKAKDVSNGTRRRCNVIPFDRQFDNDEVDRALGSKIIASNLSGLLNRALIGLKRLRTRGYFKKPKECIDAENTWLSEANSLPAFISECCRPSTHPKAKISVKDIYDEYTMWHSEQGVSGKVLGKKTFSENLSALGYNVRIGQGRQRFVLGIAVIKSSATDFDDNMGNIDDIEDAEIEELD